MITVYDHENSPIWSAIYKDKFARLGKTNGAYTYSQEIVKYHIPVMKKVLEQYQLFFNNPTIITVGNSYDIQDIGGTDLFINYLHEKLGRDLERVKKSLILPIPHIFITGRIEVKEELNKRGIPCIWLPMSVDINYLNQYKKEDNERYNTRVIFFGNKYFNKKLTYRHWKKLLNQKGIALDSICNNIYYKQKIGIDKLTREEIISVLCDYKYAIASGRCALECLALGVKTIISGEKMGGLIMNDQDFHKQSLCNLVARGVNTFSEDFETCWENIDNSILKTTTTTDILPFLETELKKTLDKIK